MLDDYVLNVLPIIIIIFVFILTGIIYYTSLYSERTRDVLLIGTLGLSFLMLLPYFPLILQGRTFTYVIAEFIPPFGISFRVDALSYSLSLLASFIYMMAGIYSLDYMKYEEHTSRYAVSFMLTYGSILGVFFAADLFTLFIFFELMSLISYMLIIHNETAEALKAGYKYLIVTVIGGLFLFLGIVVVFELSGNISFVYAGSVATFTNYVALLGYFSFLLGFGMKAGMVPLHIWLPEAHPVAPSPASALLSGLMIKTGAYGLIRISFQIFNFSLLMNTNWNLILVGFAIVTIFLGSAMALFQENLKRRLAYSSIGQMGYILLGIGIMNGVAITGSIFHIFTHAFMKSTLFLAAGAMIKKTGKKNINELRGIGHQMPFTMLAFTIASLSMIGIPPLMGFLSKWTLSMGALADGHTMYVVVLLISSLMNSLYYLPIVNSAFFQYSFDPELNKRTISPVMLLPIIILGVSCLVYTLIPFNIFYTFAEMSSNMLFSPFF